MGAVELRFTPLTTHVRTARLVAATLARRSGLEAEALDEVRLAVGESCARAVAIHRSLGLSDPIVVLVRRRSGRILRPGGGPRPRRTRQNPNRGSAWPWSPASWTTSWSSADPPVTGSGWSGRRRTAPRTREHTRTWLRPTSCLRDRGHGRARLWETVPVPIDSARRRRTTGGNPCWAPTARASRYEP